MQGNVSFVEAGDKFTAHPRQQQAGEHHDHYGKRDGKFPIVHRGG
jgi:hypothetical protein